MKQDNPTTERDELSALFDAYKPRMASGDDFARRIAERLEAVEAVKRRNAASLRRCRAAVMVAAVAGVIIGAALAAAFPVITSAAGWLLAIFFPAAVAAASILAWTAAALATVAATVAAYDIAMAATAK